MKTNPWMFGSWMAVAAASVVQAAAPPQRGPAQTSPSVFNEWLRGENASFKAWDIGGQFRFRYENFNNAGPALPSLDFQGAGVDNDDDFFLLREKLHIGYTPVSWLSVYLEGRDSSSSGEASPVNPGADQFDLHQAYVRLGDFEKFPVAAKIGRQEMSYGDERLIGAGDWINVGRVFDAAKLRYESEAQWFDVFGGRQVLVDNHQFNVADDYDWFSGIYGSCSKIIPIQATEIYVLSRNASAGTAAAGVRGTAPGMPQNSSAGSARDIYSFGTRFKSLPGKLGAWDYTAEFVYQLGSINVGGTRVDHEACAGSVNVGYTWAREQTKPRVHFEYNYASGDADPTDGKNRTLDNLFATNHKHYGYMDLIGWRNVHNPKVGFSFRPEKTLLVSLDYHAFCLVDDRDLFYPQQGAGRLGSGYGRNSSYDKFLGTELDLDATYTPNKWFTLRGGYGHFFAEGYINQSKAASGGAKDADWFYVQTTINF